MQITDPLSKTTLRRLSVTSMVFFALGCGAFFVDLSVASLVTRGYLPGDVRDLLRLSETFAHGMGAAVILIAVWMLDRTRRSYFPRLLGMVALPILAVHICKFLVVRERPRTFAVDGLLSLPASVWDTFQPFTLQLGTMTASDLQSWPSGHTATAVGLAVGLSWLYPRGRWLFAALAAMAALQRVDANAHFLSDTCFSAGISLLAVQTAWRRNRLSRWFDRLENGLANRELAVVDPSRLQDAA